MIIIKKILDITSKENLIESIAEICDCNKDSILNYIKTASVFTHTPKEEIKLEPFFKALGLKFQNKSELYDLIKFDMITVSHITTRKSTPNNTDIYPVTECLLRKNDLTTCLNNYGLIFKKNGNEVITFFNNKKIEWDNFEHPFSNRISKRLKFKGEYIDNCINGFLINEKIWEDSDVEHIKTCPEILSDICEVLDIDYIKEIWEGEAVPYVVSFLVNINDIILDSYSKYRTSKSKVYIIYKIILYYLVQSNNNLWYPKFDNEIIRLKDNLSVKKENIIDFFEIE